MIMNCYHLNEESVLSKLNGMSLSDSDTIELESDSSKGTRFGKFIMNNILIHKIIDIL